MEANLTFKNKINYDSSNSLTEPTIISYQSHGTEVRITIPYSDVTSSELADHFVKIIGCCGFAPNMLEEHVYHILEDKLKEL